MAYIGNVPADKYTTIDKQVITGDGGTGYTLDHAVANAQEIEVFVNNVRQEPGVAYTVSGTTLTMTGNVASDDDFYVVYQGKAIQTVVPADDTITTAMLQDNSVTNAKIDTMAATKLTGTISHDRMPDAIAWHITFGDGVTCTVADQFYPFTSPTARIDTSSAYDTTNNYYVAPRTGIYVLYGSLLRGNNQLVFRGEFTDDSNTVLESWNPQLRTSEAWSGYNLSAPLTHIVSLTSGDKIRWAVRCDTAGGTIYDDNGTGEYNYFGGYFIGGA